MCNIQELSLNDLALRIHSKQKTMDGELSESCALFYGDHHERAYKISNAELPSEPTASMIRESLLTANGILFRNVSGKYKRKASPSF